MKNQEKYNREFKINTVKLCRESSKSMSEIARDLEVAMHPPASAVTYTRNRRETNIRFTPNLSFWMKPEIDFR